MTTGKMTQSTLSDLREALTARRTELIDQRRDINESWRQLHEPETELEETASKATLSREMQQRSDLLQREIRDIDGALARMADGDYGRCEACHRPIQIKRLEALPWARYCVKCAGLREVFDEEEIDEEAVATGDAEFDDDQMCDAIMDQLQDEGRVETEELTVFCEDGVVYLDGTLPSDAKHQMLLETVQDVLDVKNVVDNVRIDRQPWEREARRPDQRRSDDETVEELTGEAPADGDPYTALEDGEPMTPPDAFIAEKE